MKKLLAVLLTLTFAVSLCSCAAGYGSGSGGGSDPEETTEEATKYSANIDDYVFTEKKISAPYQGDFLITGETKINSDKVSNRLPQLNMDTADTSEINDDIHAKYNRIFENLDKTDRPGMRTDYKAYLNDNVLSLIIESRSVDTPNSGFNVYNINVETGQKISSDDVITLSSYSREEADAQLKTIISEKFERLNSLTGANSDVVDEAKRKSLAGDNIAAAVYYFDGDRRLCCAYRYYWVAGAEQYGTISELDAYKTKG